MNIARSEAQRRYWADPVHRERLRVAISEAKRAPLRAFFEQTGDAECDRLRALGYTWRSIAFHLGVSGGALDRRLRERGINTGPVARGRMSGLRVVQEGR